MIQDLQRKPFCDAKHFTGHITFDAQLNRLSVQSLFIPNDKYKEKVMFYKYVDCSWGDAPSNRVQTHMH